MSQRGTRRPWSTRAGDRSQERQVKAFEETGQWAELEQLYRERIDRGDRDCYCRLGYAISQQMGRKAEAETLFRKALEIEDMPNVASLNLGVLAKRDGRTEEAVAHFEHALMLEDDRALTELAGLLCDGPRDSEAEELYRRAVEPRDRTAPCSLARYLWAAGRLDELEQLYRLALTRGHGPAPALELACLLRMTEPAREDQARALVREALEAPIGQKVLNAVVRQAPISSEAAIWALREAVRLGDAPEAAAQPYGAGTYRDELVDELIGALERAERPAEVEALLRERIRLGEQRHLCLLGYLILDENGREDEAEAVLLSALEAGVDPGATRMNLGAIAIRRGQTERAIVRYEEAWNLGATSAATELASLLAEGERDDEVEGLLRSAVEAGDGSATMALAKRLRGSDRAGEREGLLRLAVERTGDANAAVELACLLPTDTPAGQEEARALIRRALEAPIEPRRLRWIVCDKELPAARTIWAMREALNVAVELKDDQAYGAPENQAELLFLLALLLEEEPDGRSEALALYHAAERMNHPVASLNLGLLFEREEEWAEARLHFERGAALEDPWSLRGLARMLDHEDDRPGAEQALRRAVELGDERATIDLAYHREGDGDVEGAIAIAREAASSGNPEGHRALGRLLIEKGDCDEEALASLRRGIETGDGGAALNLGLVLARRDKDAAADAAYREGVELGDERCMHNLADRLAERGEFDKAEALFRRAAELGADLARDALDELPERRQKAEEAHRSAE
jgi:Flp pilus assembly protein TadD